MSTVKIEDVGDSVTIQEGFGLKIAFYRIFFLELSQASWKTHYAEV